MSEERGERINPINLAELMKSGRLFRPPDDEARLEAFIPPAAVENHAANLLALPNDDLLCVWFSGSHEGTDDVCIALARLPSGGAEWSQPRRMSNRRYRK